MTICALQVAEDHPAFAGHFPGFPILPGAVLLDQALHEIARSHGLDLMQWQLSAVKFLHTVHPGDELILDYSPANDATIRFVIRSAGTDAVSGTLSAVPAIRRPDGA